MNRKELYRPAPGLPADLHPDTVRLIDEYFAKNLAAQHSQESENEQKLRALLGVLNMLSEAWRAQHTPTPDISLEWSLYDNELLFLDNVFITHISRIKEIDLHDYSFYTINLTLVDSRIEIVIVDIDNKTHKIERIDREIDENYKYR